MLTLNYKRAFSHIIILASIINVILAFLLAPSYKAVGISVAVVITETFITIAMYIYLRYKGINLLDLKNV